MEPILYIEDEEDYQLLVHRILNKAGLAVQMASTGQEGLKILEIRRPSLLILDINLPDTDGYAICRQLRRDPQWIDLPILMLTVRRRPEEWLQGFASGVNDYISKPLNPPELIERVWNCLEKKSLFAQKEEEAEIQLIKSASSGNRAAYQVLIQKYRPRLIESMALIIKNDTQLEDLVSYAFAMAYEKLGEFRNQSSFFTWLYRISVNQCTKVFRQPASISFDSLDHAGELQLLPARPEESPDNCVADSDAATRARKALELVPYPYKEILELFFLEDLSYDHIAHKLNIPRGTVMSRLHKGRKLLQEASRAVL